MNYDTERWAPVPYLPGLEASTHGRIRDALSGKHRALKRNPAGTVRFVFRGKRYTVSTAVYNAFNPDTNTTARYLVHVDGDLSNNRLDNIARAEDLARAQNDPEEFEFWDVPETHPHLEVSSHGRVRNTRTGNFIRSINHKRDRLKTIHYRGERIPVVELMTSAFTLFDPATAVDYKDGDFTNTQIDNLEWT